ncbi:MAG: efflux RND transporter periplasmic adaptor subunit [Deltaproteobacteria bacterium]
MSKRKLIILLVVLATITGCGEKPDAAKKEEAVPVKVIKVELRDIQKTLDYVGDIKAQDEAIVYPKVNGKVIEKLEEEGASVNKGDVIAYIDRDEVGFKFEKAPVESPLTGIVGRVYVDIGTSVTQQTPIALVVDMDKMRVNLDITEEYLPKITLGQTAEVRLQAYPNETFIGEVFKISPVLDLSTRTAPIEITIPNSDHRLKSGMFAKVQLILEKHKDVPVIAKEAILGREPNVYVYVVEGNVARQKIIKLGIHQGASYEVTEGLNAGDVVVVMGQQRLYDGALVLTGEK